MLQNCYSGCTVSLKCFTKIKDCYCRVIEILYFCGYNNQINQDNMAQYKRILLKLSGESLMGGKQYGIDEVRLNEYATQIKEL